MVRGVTELSGLREIRTMFSARKRSIPRVQSSAYLDLYMLHKEKDRLGKEVYILKKREKGIRKRISEVNAEIDKLEKAEAKRREAESERFGIPSGKEWKKMTLNY